MGGKSWIAVCSLKYRLFKGVHCLSDTAVSRGICVVNVFCCSVITAFNLGDSASTISVSI